MKTMRRSTFALASVAVLPLALAGCTEKSTANTDDITVTASDETCDVSADSGTTGSSTFQVTNNGSKVTEFYVYAEGDRAMGEVENIGPGLTRQLIVSLPDAGTYQLACKPGMVGNGIRQEFTVTGDSMSASDESGQLAEAADATAATSAVRSSPCRTPRSSSSTPSRPATSIRPRHCSPSPAPTTSASSRRRRASVSSIPSSICGRPTSSPGRNGRASTDWRRTCG